MNFGCFPLQPLLPDLPHLPPTQIHTPFCALPLGNKQASKKKKK